MNVINLASNPAEVDNALIKSSGISLSNNFDPKEENGNLLLAIAQMG
jgi:hypothetical protein